MGGNKLLRLSQNPAKQLDMFFNDKDHKYLRACNWALQSAYDELSLFLKDQECKLFYKGLLQNTSFLTCFTEAIEAVKLYICAELLTYIFSGSLSMWLQDLIQLTRNYKIISSGPHWHCQNSMRQPTSTHLGQEKNLWTAHQVLQILWKTEEHSKFRRPFKSFTASISRCLTSLVFSLIICTTVKLPLQMPMHHSIIYCCKVSESIIRD